MTLRCYYCGHSVTFGRADGNYEGALRCTVCKNVMRVRIEHGRLRAMGPGPEPAPPPAGQSPGCLSHLN